MSGPAGGAVEAAAERLAERLGAARRLLVLTGAGLSTPSGIPDYRDRAGRWKHPRPLLYQDFVSRRAARCRYWARSLAGWGPFAAARPNPGHRALAALEAAGRVAALITQNVDGLHQRAGSRRVIELHGSLARVRCLACGAWGSRAAFQRRLLAANPGWMPAPGVLGPDGDAEPAPATGRGAERPFALPGCPRCAGILKPDVVFFGESVPRARVERARAALARADAVLVAGSSLMVFSGYRFAREAAERGIPLAIVALGRTRADPLATVKVEARCERLLPCLARLLGA